MRVNAKTITTEQVFQLRGSLARIDSMYAICDIAVGAREPSPKARRIALRSVAAARYACARAWNSRFPKETP